MAENPLIALAAAMRTALATPVDVSDKAAQTARLDIIDMVPDLQLKLIGEQAMIRNMTWSVLTPGPFPRPQYLSPFTNLSLLSAPEPRHPAGNQPLQNRPARAAGYTHFLYRSLSHMFCSRAPTQTAPPACNDEPTLL